MKLDNHREIKDYEWIQLILLFISGRNELMRSYCDCFVCRSVSTISFEGIHFLILYSDIDN